MKCRAIDHQRVGSDITSPFRSFDFDAAVIVLLDPIHLGVGRAAELSVDLVRQHASYRKHVNGHVLLPSPGLMDLGVDKTIELRSAAERH